MTKFDEEKLTEYATRLESSTGSESESDPQIEYLYLTPIEEPRPAEEARQPDAPAPSERSEFTQPLQVTAQVTAQESIASAQATQEGAAVAARAALPAPIIQPAGAPASTFFIGHYQIERAIGRGGMGDVYLAKDTRLGRPVAVKLLRADYNPTEARVRRFHQEARAVCALNHPNIVTIYEVGESNGSPYIVSEFIEGLTLRRLIPPYGMKVHLALDVAIQIASALSAAHQTGIVHRDIKPENVMVRGDGYVKVLDFGLAKLSDALEGRENQSFSMFSTAPGVVLGTISYMSPEQARAQQVDGRTDVFSLGIVIYEMVTGRKPFTGSTTSDVLAAILKLDPAPIATHVPDIPEELQWIVNRAIRKTVDARYPSINELLQDLRELRDELAMRSRQERKTNSKKGRTTDLLGRTSRGLAESLAEFASGAGLQGEQLDLSRETVSLQGAPAGASSAAGGNAAESRRDRLSRASRPARPSWMPATLVVIALMAVLVAAIVGYRYWNAGASVSFEHIRFQKFTHSGQVSSAAISPDGRYIAFIQSENGNQEGVWLRQVNTASAVQILPPADVSFTGLKFSRDGNFLYYLMKDRISPTPATLYRVPTLGGAPQRLFVIPDGSFDLSPDGKRLAYFRKREGGEVALMTADTASWEETKIASRQAPNEFPFGSLAWSGDGERIATGCMDTDAAGKRSQLLISVDVRGGKEHAISSERWRYVGDIAWMPNDQGVIVIGSALNTRTDQLYYIAPSGESHHVTNDLNRYAVMSMTADGRSIAAIQIEDPLNLWVASADDLSHARPVTRGVGRYYAPSWTPDGALLTDSDVSGVREIWRLDPAGGRSTQLTSRDQKNMIPLMTPDRRYLIVQSSRNGRLNLWRTDLDESHPVQLTQGEADNWPQLSPDGRWVYYSAMVAGQWTVWRVPVAGGSPAQIVGTGHAYSPVISPNGRLLAYNHTDPVSKQSRIVILPAEGGAPIKTFDLPQTAGGLVRWAFGGSGVTYLDDRTGASEIWFQPLEGGPPRQLTNFQTERIFSFAWSSDGRSLAVSRGARVSDAVMITNVR